MKPSEMYSNLLTATGERLQPVGFRRAGSSFFIRDDSNWGVISMQRHPRNTPSDTHITVEVGVASAKLLNFHNPSRKNTRPAVGEFTWRRRIGSLMGPRHDQWWRLQDINSGAVSSDDVIGAIERVGIPWVFGHLTDTQLMDSWARGEWDGMTRTGAMTDLAVLQFLYGDPKLSATVAQIEADPAPTMGRREVVGRLLARLRLAP